MKRLRRASLKSSDNKPQAVAAITSTSSSEPPLYARFATTHKLQNGSTPAKPVVSGPMALTPRPSLQRIPSRGTTSSERDVSRLRRVDSKSEQLTTPPPRMSSRGTLAAKAQSPPTPTPQPLQQSVSLDMGSNGLADQLRPAITRTNAPAATLFRPQPEFNDMVSQRLQAGIRAESGREIAEVQSAVRSPASFSTGVVSPSDRRDGELPSPTKPARRPSASVLPKEPKEDHRASESRPTASPQQRAAEAQPSAQVKASTSDYGSPQKAARNPPVTSRKRVSRAIEQQRISYDLSPENYQKIMQAQAGVSRQEEPIPPFTTEAAEESRVVLSPQPQSRRSPHNVSHDIPVSSTTGQTSTLIPSPPSPSKSRSSHPHRTRRLLNEQSSSPGPSSPSMVRKKYSPMAAFGLPVGKGVEAVAASVQSVEPDDKAQAGPDVDGSMLSGYDSLPEIPTIPTPQPLLVPLPELPPPLPEPTWIAPATAPERTLPATPTPAVAAQENNASEVSPEPHESRAANDLKPPQRPEPTSPDLLVTMPTMTTTVVKPPETRVRILSSTRAQSTPKKEPPPFSGPSSQAGYGTQPGHSSRSRKLSSSTSKANGLPRRDSPPTNSPAPSSPKGQPRKLGDPVDFVSLDTSLPSDSRYPLPSRSSSRSTPSPALNTSSRASPTGDIPDSGKAGTNGPEVTSSTRVKPRGARHYNHSSESSNPVLTPSQPPTIMDNQGPAYQTVPIRGRPLIFAAMTVAPEEVASVEPGSTPEDEGVFVGDSYDSPYSGAPYGYPSPTSSGRRSPQKSLTPPAESQTSRSSEPEGSRRPRKLSKNKKPSPPVQAVVKQPEVESTPADHLDDTLYHHHHRHQPSLSQSQTSQHVDTDQHEAQLGAPFQLQQPQPVHPGYSSGEESPRKRPIPLDHKSSRHGVKTLTDKQLEKLNRRSTHNIHAAAAQEHDTPPPPQPMSPPPHPPSKQRLAPPTPPSPEDYAKARSQRRGHTLDKSRAPLPAPPLVEPEFFPAVDPPPVEHDTPGALEEPRSYPLTRHVADPILFGNLLRYLAYFEWCQLSAVSKEIRMIVSENRELEERVLERYLRTVGYDRWTWKQPEPLKLNLQDLSNYMRGVSIPSHQYARTAEAYLQLDSTVSPATVQEMAASCRAFTRVVLRLRAQAEAEAEHNARLMASLPRTPPRTTNGAVSPPNSRWGHSRSSSRAPSPTSSYGHSHSQNVSPSVRSGPVNTFRSPLFRPRRAPLLQVFIPSPEGDWLSDASVLGCEAELKKAGVLHCMRAGDVVWDVAVGDEGNVGRLVWDGSYLIDLDYTYSRVGDLPRYLPTLAFPPSYFHRVIRTMGTGNPVVHVDLAPWADQIASNLQLLQDRMKTETPQGGHHTVVRWVHRSTFIIKPPPGSRSIRIPVPSTAGPGPSPSGAWIIDPGWYGTVVVETEGTNEGLADLQARCQGAFPLRAEGAAMSPERAHREERRTVFRILRERSRPGEIWLRTVREKERLLPQ